METKSSSEWADNYESNDATIIIHAALQLKASYENTGEGTGIGHITFEKGKETLHQNKNLRRIKRHCIIPE